MTAIKRKPKARGNGEGTIYKRVEKRVQKDGTVVEVERYCSAVSLDGGKRKVLYGRTRKEVADKLNDALRDVKKGLPLPGSRLSTAKYLNDWLEHTVKPSRRANTYRLYELMIRCHIVPSIGRIPLAKLEPRDIQRLQATVVAGGLNPATVGVLRSVLSGALTQAEKWGLVTRNVVPLVAAPATEEHEPHVLAPEQAAALRTAARGHDMEHLFTTMMVTGLRIGEALGLRWRDVQLDDRVPVLHVRQQAVKVGVGPRVFDEPKSRTGRRTVPLIAIAVEALRAQRDRQTFQRRAVGDLWQDHDLVFPNELGEVLAYDRAKYQFHRLCAKAGLPEGYTLHSLRHSAGTYLTAAGVPDRVVMEILGHSTIAMTQHYQHVVSTMIEDAGRRLEAFFPTARVGQ